MGRPPKNPDEVFSYDARTKIPKWLHDAIAEDARRQLKNPSDLHREMLLEKYKDLKPSGDKPKRKGK